MEERFRERAQRSGGGPVSTGEIDSRVQDEMQAFFAESAERLESVVPGIAEQGQMARKESTEEIRKKIDDFFAQVPEGNAAPAEPTPEPPPASRPVRRSSAPVTPASPAPSAGKLDLRTALERLRRGGAVSSPQPSPPPQGGSLRSSDVAAPPPRRRSTDHEAPLPPPPVVRPQRAHVPQPTPPAPEQRPDPVVGSVREPTAALPQPGETRLNADEVGPEDIRIVPERKFQPTREERGRAPRDESLPRAGVPSFGSASTRMVDGRTPDRQPGASVTERRGQGAALPPLPTPRGRSATAATPSPVAPPPQAVPQAPPSVSEGPEDFDAIFDEVQGLVMDTLKGSVAETFDSARESERELLRATRPQGELVESDLESELEAAEQGGAAVATPPTRPEPEARAVHAPPPPPAAAAPVEPPVVASPASTGRFSAPVDDEFDEEDPEAAAPDGPYDWGVQKKAGPPGSWLLDEQVDETPPTLSEPDDEPAPAASAGAGARGFLRRKLADQVQQMGPVVNALAAKGLVSPADLVDPAQPVNDDDDDDISVDSFTGQPRIDLEKELSPTRLVEELRRLRRLQDALLRTGVITEADLAYTDEE